MQLLATADQMQAFDRAAIESLGIPGSILMENAGRAFVDVLQSRVPNLSGCHAVVLCGKGNNGGDGFVIARHLLNRGAVVTVVLLSPRKDSRGDAKLNLDILAGMVKGWGGRVRILTGMASLIHTAGHPPDIIVDAIFGTGFKGKVAGTALKAIQSANNAESYRASVDICSGANATTGGVSGVAFKAHLTVTMGLAKTGHYLSPCRENSGDVVCVDISIPKYLLNERALRTFRLESADVKRVLPKRSLRAHKYSVGKVFVLAGSTKFTGAAFLASQAAIRSGAGAVILGTPGSVGPILSRKFNEVIVEPLGETLSGSISSGAWSKIAERVKWADSIVIGPGLSRDEETMELTRYVLARVEKPLLLDADGLFAISDYPEILRKRKAPTVLTPHTGELGLLTGESAVAIENARVESARESARKFKCTVVLKGSPTVTATGNGIAYLNPTGNPGMATIGSGDVLSGIIGSLLAQQCGEVESAYSGVYLHGLAGDIARSRFGERSMVASDILAQLPSALQELEVE
jgi:ADP-dependent NAD(P)H-hydrate dehydratase / NAD(P)H-hydrate epimerase